MKKLPSGWYLLAWVISGFLTLLSGVIDRNDVAIFVGAVMAFGFTSAYLTSCVKSEHRLKKPLEVILMLLTFGVIVYGYIVTRSLILGVITLFIVAMIFFAFVVSWTAISSELLLRANAAKLQANLPPVRGKFKVRFHCSECSHNFDVSWLRLLFTRRFSGYATPHPNLPFPWPDPTTIPKVAYYLKCQKCGKKSWLIPTT